MLACCRLPAAGLAKEGSALIRALSGLPKLGRWGKNREVTVLQPVLETTQVRLKTAQHTAVIARHNKTQEYTTRIKHTQQASRVQNKNQEYIPRVKRSQAHHGTCIDDAKLKPGQFCWCSSCLQMCHETSACLLSCLQHKGGTICCQL